MRKTLTLLIALTALFSGTIASISAQTGTPEAAGGAIPVIGSDGQPTGTIVVDAILDPFKDFDPSNPPQRGFHYVGVTLTVNATAAFPAGYFSLVDVDGFVYQQAYVYRGNTDALPDLDLSSLTPGSSVTGSVFFQALDGVKTGLVLYQPSYQQLVTIADLRDSTVAPGTPVNVIASDGSPAGTITIGDVQNPLKDYDASNPPQRGFSYIGVTVTVQNTASTPLTVDPSSFQLYDSEGFAASSTSIYRSQEATTALPDLQYGTSIEPGQTVTGFIGFEALTGSEPGMIVYAPSSDRHIRVAEFGSGGATPGGSSTAPSGPTPAPPPPSATTAPAPTAIASDLDCDAIVEWAKATVTNINAWSEAMNAAASLAASMTTGDLSKIDTSVIDKAQSDLESIAANQQSLDVPSGVESISDAVNAAFANSAAAVKAISDAVKANDVAGLMTAFASLGQASSGISSPEMSSAIEALTVACPELQDIGV